MKQVVKLTRKDFASDQEVRWCPGCGDYAILAAIQKTLAAAGADTSHTVFVSGIGCSGRFPYYMSTFGFHTVHGRAPAFATGLKLTRPELDVWVMTGDGDGLSIGGNHLLHVLRRNVDLQIVMFNNEIYGLTKGQYSPTTERGHVTPSSPLGTVDMPIHPARFVLGAGGAFYARGYDVSKKLPGLMEAAREFQGAGFLEVLQNCPVFNDGVFDDTTARKTAAEKQLWVEHGKKLVFGEEGHEKGIVSDAASFQLRVIPINTEADRDQVLLHDETNLALAQQLVALTEVMAFGVIYRDPSRAEFAKSVRAQIRFEDGSQRSKHLEELLRDTQTWSVK